MDVRSRISVVCWVTAGIIFLIGAVVIEMTLDYAGAKGMLITNLCRLLLFGFVCLLWDLLYRLLLKSQYYRNLMANQQIKMKHLRVGDIVTLNNIGACRYDGFTEGFYQFSYEAKNSELTFIRMSAKQCEPIINKVKCKHGIIWERF